jgi:acetolactate synthase-1/2/3 large subunit
MDPEELVHIIPRAFEIAESGRPGPVVIDVPKDVQLSEINVQSWPDFSGARSFLIPDMVKVQEIAYIVNTSKRPLIYAGGGIIHSGASIALFALAQKNSIPVTLTLMGLGAFPPNDPLYLGMLGMHGSQATNHILYEADTLFVFGARFDDRAVGKAQEFCPNATIVHIDIDQAEINKIRRSAVSLAGDIRCVLKNLLPLVDHNNRPTWTEHIRNIQSEFPGPDNVSCEDPFNPRKLITHVSALTEPDTIITTDVGQHQMWVAQNYPFRQPRTLLTSGGLGTMGFGLPAAIGAALANPDRQVICISGDGSIQMNIQEFATLAELNLNVKILIMNNQHLGLVRQQQELFFDNNYIASKFARRLDFAAIAREFGIRGMNLTDAIHPEETIRLMLKEPGPCVIDIPIHDAENVYPMVPPGAAIREMITGSIS